MHDSDTNFFSPTSFPFLVCKSIIAVYRKSAAVSELLALLRPGIKIIQSRLNLASPTLSRTFNAPGRCMYKISTCFFLAGEQNLLSSSRSAGPRSFVLRPESLGLPLVEIVRYRRSP